MRLLTTAVLAGLLVPLVAVPGGEPGHPRSHIGAPVHASPRPSTHPRPFIAYSRKSFLKSKVIGAPIDKRLTASFRQFMATFHDQQGTPYPTVHGIDGNPWGMPYAMSNCAEPVWRIRAASGDSPRLWVRLMHSGFHAPASFGSRLTNTNDSPFVVIDRCNHFTVWASSARVVGRHLLDVKSFGAFRHRTNGLDRRNPRSNSTKNTRSRGVIPDSMLIRKDLMHWAIVHQSDLGQVLEFFFVETDGTGTPCFTSPMIACEPKHRGWGSEGTRIAVAPWIRLGQRHCTPQALAIARTLKYYGGYLGDNSGGATALKAQQATTGHPLWHGVLQRNELQGCISWNDFVVIKPGWQ